MERRRYLEGGSVPSLSFPSYDSTVTTQLRSGRRTKYVVPTNVTISNTSNAKQCFVNREFSMKMQQFLLNYAFTIVTANVLSGEI